MRGGGLPGCLWLLILLVPVSGLTQGPFWWVHVHPSVKTDSSWKVSGRLTGHIMDWQLLLPLAPPYTKDLLHTCVTLEIPP